MIQKNYNCDTSFYQISYGAMGNNQNSDKLYNMFSFAIKQII